MCGRDCNERKLLSAKKETITRPGVQDELDNVVISLNSKNYIVREQST